jgi:predicted nucleic acid-binding protein
VSRVFWDTNLFIYLFEGSGELAERVVALRQRMIERRDTLLTSSLSLGEVMVKPIAEGNPRLAETYRVAIGRAARIVAFDESAARRFADIRADTRIRAPDAIQLACAAVSSADLFITNDDRLARLSIAGIQFITSLEGAPI